MLAGLQLPQHCSARVWMHSYFLLERLETVRRASDSDRLALMVIGRVSRFGFALRIGGSGAFAICLAWG